MNTRTAQHIRRACLALAFAAGIWATGIAVTGGVDIHLAGARVTSHAVRNPALFALAAAAIAIWLARPAYRETLVNDLRAAVAIVPPFAPATWLLIAGIGLRVWCWLLATPFWLDEEMIALNIRSRPLSQLGGALWMEQAAPLGWLATERIVGLTLGFSEIVLRATPVAFGVATLIVAWWAGRRWMSVIGAAALVFLVGAGQWMFHFSLELKHYSADACFGLLLPALVAWALEGGDARERLRRAAIWWAAAIVGQWWSMGGLLVAPACAVALVVALWRRDGRRSAVAVVAFGCVWLAFFALNYALALRFLVGHSSLPAMWSNRMAPATGGAFDRLRWLIQQGEPLARIPGGTELAILFWATALIGLVVARPRILGAIFAAVPVSAVVLALARVVPLYERFVLWTLPAIYFGIASALDAGDRWARTRPAPPVIVRVAGVLAAVAAIVLCVDIGRRGDLLRAHPGDSNHGLNDRAAVEWLAAQQRPGDALITTHLAAPAVWWYAKVPMSATAVGASLGDMPILEAGYEPPSSRCDAGALERSLNSYTRALVHFGFRFDDVPKGFDMMLLNQLEALGALSDFQKFSDQSIGAIVVLAPPERRAPHAPAPPGLLRGCLTMKLAARW